MPINDINGVAWSNINDVNGVAVANIADINGVDAPSSQTDYVSSGLELHLNASDSSSYSGPSATTWNDLSGNGHNVTLVNGPTEPTDGDGYVSFDGTDDYGTITWASGDYFHGSSTNYTFWDEFSFTFVVSFPEDGSTGQVVTDAVARFGSRQQNSNMRCLWMQADLRGIWIGLAYGSTTFFSWPADSNEFVYNTTYSRWQPQPDRVYHCTLTMDRTTSPHVITYLNGQTYTVAAWQGSYVSGTNTGSQANLIYINNSQVRRGPATWYLAHTQFSSGSLVSSSTTCDIREVMLYNDRLTAAEVDQNYDAYVERYGNNGSLN
jgi:hypothetical protein